MLDVVRELRREGLRGSTFMEKRSSFYYDVILGTIVLELSRHQPVLDFSSWLSGKLDRYLPSFVKNMHV